MFWNQLSNKGYNYMNNESPFLFFQESKGNKLSNLCNEMATPRSFQMNNKSNSDCMLLNKLMSPGSQYGNIDFLKYQAQLSNSLFLLENKESPFLNASPYLIRPVVTKTNVNFNNISISNNFGREDDEPDFKPKSDRKSKPE
uniref:Uncharacterized protein n=1 Tax=Euplotes harpa TaxID=151035 RepID=A0A7S3J991_9SPIT|mmetsp:Transcript_26795/g.30927  ORF Transcript_26795/g.30927 Transcript_26795/m.30927 type:complete len:142 (+) Transcript_26795:591-1016(+)